MSFASKLVSNFKKSLKEKIECLTCDCEGSCEKEYAGPPPMGYVEPSQQSELEEHEPFIWPNGMKLSQQEERMIFEEAFTTDEGRTAVANTLSENIEKAVECLSLARKVLDVQDLDFGELPRFDKPYHSPSLTVNGKTRTVDTILEGEEVFGPCGEVTSYIQSRLSSLKANPKRALIAASEKAIEEIVDGEDELLLKVLLKFPETREHGIWECPKLTHKDIDQAFLSIEANSSIVTKIIMNPERFAELRDMYSIDEATTREILTTRVYGHIRTADIHVNKFCPLDTILFTGIPKTLGTFYVRQNVTALPADDPNRLTVNHVVYEECGFMLLDNCEIAKIVIQDGKRSVRDRPIKGVVPSKSNIKPDMDKLQELLDEMEAEMVEDNAIPPKRTPDEISEATKFHPFNENPGVGVRVLKPTKQIKIKDYTGDKTEIVDSEVGKYTRRPMFRRVKPKSHKVEVDFENSPFHIDMCEDAPKLNNPICPLFCSTVGEGMNDNHDGTHTCEYCKCTTKDKPEEIHGELIDNAVACGVISEKEAVEVADKTWRRH